MTMSKATKEALKEQGAIKARLRAETIATVVRLKDKDKMEFSDIARRINKSHSYTIRLYKKGDAS